MKKTICLLQTRLLNNRREGVAYQASGENQVSLHQLLKTTWMVCCMLMVSLVTLAQTNQTITGRITDEKGQPIANASVLAKGTKVGTNTNSDGNFTITCANTVKYLTVSSLNFTTKDVAIGANKQMAISLSPVSENLNEVVVVGYASINKSSLTGSVAKVKGTEVANKPILSFDQGLAGKAAGVMVNTSSGLIGDNVNIRIRGAASISSGSQPLIVMDGVPLSQQNNGQLYNPVNLLADINPNDIESVEVLKDASAASIYGSRASAGVLLITTKKGRAGTTTLTFDTYVGQTSNSRKLQVLNGDQYTTVINKMRSNAGLANAASNVDLNGDGVPDATDWQEATFRKGFTQNHQLSISGGAGRTTFFGSVSFNDYENYIIVNRQKRISARLNLTSKVTDWLEIGLKTQVSKTTSYGLGSGTGGALSGVPFGPLTASPNLPIYDASGNYYTGLGGNGLGVTNNTPNPVAVQKLNFDTRDNKRFIGSFYGEVTLMKGLKFKSQINSDYLTGFTDQFWNPTVGDGSGLVGVGQVVSNSVNVWSWYNTLNFNKKIGDHDINVLAGNEYTRSKGFVSYTFGINLNDPLFTLITSSNYGSNGVDNAIDVNNGLASYFGGINYGFKNKYLATVNFRTDAYSGFGRSNRWGYFPSGSVAWKISEEKFWKLNFMSDVKLRTSYGITGNSNIGNYPSLATFAPTQYADLPSLNNNNLGNSSLRWEQTAQFDAGMDATLFKKYSVTLDYYKKNTKDLILNNPVLATVGSPTNTITQNIGAIQTQGVELSLGMPLVNKKDFAWDLNFNTAWNKTKVISTNTNNDDIAGGQSLVRPGFNMSAFFLIRWAGVNPENGLPTFLDINGVQKQYDQSAPAASRWTKVSDKSVTTAITAADRYLDNNKTPYPKFFGGLSQTFKYKNIDLVLDMQYALGFYVYDGTMATLVSLTTNRNKSADLLNAWSKPGDVTNIPRLYFGDNQAAQASTRFLEKGDFARMRNVQLGYNVSKKILDKWKISRLRLYAQIQNAFLITGYKGIDPEANANGNVNIGLGVDNFRPYLPRTITFGLNMGF